MSNHSDDNRSITSEFPRVDYDAWKSRVDTELGHVDFAQALVTETTEDLEIQPLYTAASASQVSPWGRLDRSASKPWVMCQSYNTPDLDQLGIEIRDDLEGGVQGISLFFDRRLRGSRIKEAASIEADGDGVSLETEEDLYHLLTSLQRLPNLWMMDAGAHALQFGKMLLNCLEQHPNKVRSTQVCLGVDPLGTFARDGIDRIDPNRAEQDVVSAADLATTSESRILPISISTTQYVDGGSDAVSELAYALSTAVQYLRWLEAAGGPVEQSGALFVFRLGLGKDIFLEIAKLRAFRLLWDRVLKACGSASSRRCWVHSDTSKRILTGIDLPMNLLRVTTATFAAIVGGADSIASPAYDSTLCKPSSRGRRLARNTQSILRDESHLGRVMDPGAGSYYIESLTGSVAHGAWQVFQKLEQSGGILESLQSGTLRSKIDETWSTRNRRFAERHDPITGISFFADPNDGSEPGQSLPSEPRSSTSGPRTTGPAIAPHRDSNDYEIIRDLADQVTSELGHRPSVFLATLPSVSRAREPVSFARNFFSAGGFLVFGSDSESNSASGDRVDSLIQIWQHYGSEIFCICSSTDADRETTARLAEEAATRGALAVVSIESNPTKNDGNSVSAIDLGIYPSIDAVATLRDLLERCTTDS